jgi:hypothetical protein
MSNETLQIGMDLDALIGEKPIGFTPTGKKVYKTDDPGEMYKNPEEILKESLLDQTPEKDRYYLKKTTLVEKTDNGRYRKGYIQEEDNIVTRIKNEKGNPIIKNGLIKYQALTIVKYSFLGGYGKHVHQQFEPGEYFYAPKSGEDKEKKKEMLKQAKRYH